MIDELSDLAAERGVLSLIAKYGKEAYLEVSDFLKSTTFTYPPNQFLYGVLSHILNTDLEKKIDLGLILSTAKDLGISGQLNEDKYLQKVLGFNTELSNIKGFAKKIRILEIGRQLIGTFSDTQEEIKKIKGTESLSEVVSIAETPVFNFISSLTSTDQQIQPFAEGIDEYVEGLMENPQETLGVSIGFEKYEKSVGYLEDGVHVITSRPGVGKSTTALNGALHAAHKDNAYTLLLDTEMNKEKGQFARALSRISGIKFDKIRRGKLNEIELNKVNKAQNILKSMPFDYINISGKEFEEVISLIRRWLIQKVGFNNKGKLNKAIIFYDYLKLTDYNALKVAKEYEMIGMRMSQLHDLTAIYKFPIITFTQLNRENEISQSDRILWYATSLSNMMVKSQDEIIADGVSNGNRKLVIKKARFGWEPSFNDYINFNLYGAISTIKELTYSSEMVIENDQENTGN